MSLSLKRTENSVLSYTKRVLLSVNLHLIFSYAHSPYR